MMHPLRRVTGYDDSENSMFDSFEGAFPLMANLNLVIMKLFLDTFGL